MEFVDKMVKTYHNRIVFLTKDGKKESAILWACLKQKTK